jgi:osmotically-inducible protein OsmY
MNPIHSLRLAAGILIAVASFNAWPQASETGSGPAMAASNGTTAKTARQANRALRKQIYAAFAQRKEIDAGDISVSAKSGAVTLSGTVKNTAQIDTVGDIAKGVPGVISVNNKLTVQRPFN